MSALDTAFPLALSAAIYPPALLVLILLLAGEHPRRLVGAYFAGAALMVFGVGLIGLAVLDETSTTTKSNSSASGGVQIAVGILLLALSAWLWRRRNHQPDKPVADAPEKESRVTQWSERATTSQKWAFVLGIVMFLPSPLYLLAISDISNSGSSTSSQVAAVLICAAGVLIFLEITLIALFLRPGSVATGLERANAWLGRNGWTLGAIVAFVAGIYALVEGFDSLS
jgi:uncharacterized membrane protein YidH (DUF202 family)